MPDVFMKLTVHARGEMATKLLAAAEELGLHVRTIRMQSEGFLVPEEVHQHLFPSQYAEAPLVGTGDDDDDPDDPNDTRYNELDFAELREHAKARDLSAGGTADEIRARLRADDDFSGE